MALFRKRFLRRHRAADEESAGYVVELERALLDAERIMMQTLQTSLSLIGFGFSITAFFTPGVGEMYDRPHARLVGEVMLALGLLMLALGLWTHTRYRQHVVKEIQRAAPGRGYGMRYSHTPSFIIAVLLLLLGVAALVAILFRRLF